MLVNLAVSPPGWPTQIARTVVWRKIYQEQITLTGEFEQEKKTSLRSGRERHLAQITKNAISLVFFASHNHFLCSVQPGASSLFAFLHMKKERLLASQSLHFDGDSSKI